VTNANLPDRAARVIVQLRNQGAISNDVMHRIGRDLGLKDSGSSYEPVTGCQEAVSQGLRWRSRYA
jgi:hypothetical protein